MKIQYYIAGGMLISSALMMYDEGVTLGKFLGNMVIIFGLVYFLDNHKKQKEVKTNGTKKFVRNRK